MVVLEGKLREGDEPANVIHVDFGSGGGPVRVSDIEQTSAQAVPCQGLHNQGLYSAAQVTRVCRIDLPRLRYWQRCGVLKPSVQVSGRRYYGFRDLVELRTLQGLVAQGVSVGQVRRSVESLRRAFPTLSRPLSQVRIMANGRSILALDGTGAYEPVSGQSVLCFHNGERQAEAIRLLHLGHGARVCAYEHYLEGCRLSENEGDTAAAEKAYKAALTFDPTFSGALTNLGHIEVQRGNIQAAEHHYRCSLECEPGQSEVLFQLGLLCLKTERVREAVTWLRQASDNDLEFADAHFCLAMALLQCGQPQDARRYWKRYLTLDPDGALVDTARRYLEKYFTR